MLKKEMENNDYFHKESKSEQNANQESLFSLSDTKIEIPGLQLDEAQPMKPEEKLKWEKELLGLYVSGHPLDRYRNAMSRSKINLNALRKFRAGSPVMFLAMIEQVRKTMTKNGEEMAFVKLCDLSGDMEMVVFPNTLSNFRSLLEEDRCVIIKGKLSNRNNETSIVCEELREVK